VRGIVGSRAPGTTITSSTTAFGSPPAATTGGGTDTRNGAVVRGGTCFQVQVNEFFKAPVPAPLKNAFSIYVEENDEDRLDVDDVVTLLTAAPGSPGVPRPLWLVMLGSLPTGLMWYGYYKFAVEEELLQMELEDGRDPRGFGGYGTLGPFTYGFLLGPLASFLHVPGGLNWSALGVIFIYYTQFLLYDRVNQLYRQEGLYEPPLQVWWCLPIFFPFNLIVGLRQVHFLAQYLYRKRGLDSQSRPDLVTEFFPFIQVPNLTWQEFLTTPSLWCSLLSTVETIDTSSLPEPVQRLLQRPPTARTSKANMEDVP
jgi:hypothetical protein